MRYQMVMDKISYIKRKTGYIFISFLKIHVFKKKYFNGKYEKP